ncbi:MAG: hypothetical protein R3B65_02600 [Candidatus Paceibacterota bacterium]
MKKIFLDLIIDPPCAIDCEDNQDQEEPKDPACEADCGDDDDENSNHRR